MRYKIIGLLGLMLGRLGHAQQVAVPDSVGPDRIVAYSFANDAFFRTDYYFTQGMALNVVHPLLRRSPVNRLLLGGGNGTINYHGIKLYYDGFTPLRIQDPFIRLGDRPYASYIYAALYRVANSPARHQRLTSAINVGFIGPVAGAKGFQTAVHRWLDAPTPRGWDYQVRNDVVLGYQVTFEKQVAALPGVAELLGHATASAGTLHTFAGAGPRLRVGRLNPYFENLGVTARPRQSGLRRFQLYAQGQLEARLVGYNAALQGGLLRRDNPYTLSASQISRGVLRGSGGVVAAYNGFSVEAGAAYVSPEFRWARSHRWAHLTLQVAF
ncbi:lipid A deacylase LpxR family protein [Hymenobacter koreensis]|uniref:Lipid A deacylase LpxR family protein n=1 Tax=Hymenobacter koreensis TaxID=1084523 RepID=A0ABP8IXY0_9BACT